MSTALVLGQVPGLVLGLVLATTVPLTAAQSGGQRDESPRIRVLAGLSCESKIASMSIDLFANGTVRVRDQVEEDRQMLLGELDPDELEGFMARLRAIDLSEVDTLTVEAPGDWIKVCKIRLGEELGGYGPFYYHAFGSLSLGLGTLITAIEDLPELSGVIDSEARPLKGYVPVPGDLLRRHDGELFEVVNRTADGMGVELSGVDQPLVIYLSLDQLAAEYHRVENDR